MSFSHPTIRQTEDQRRNPWRKVNCSKIDCRESRTQQKGGVSKYGDDGGGGPISEGSFLRSMYIEENT